MRRRLGIPLRQLPEPEPAYGLYQQLRVDAESRSRGFLGPDDVRRFEEIASRRGGDWCTAVLGYTFPGINYVSTIDGWHLVHADELGIDPPLPARIIQAREETAARDRERQRQETERRDRERRQWDALVAAAGVEVTVRANTRHTGTSGALRHAVPNTELLSGRSRRHLPGRGLCETPGRADPLHLSDPSDDPANCRRCLTYMEQVRALGAPVPPTAAERRLLQLVSEGAVFTFHVARRPATIRDTSQRSKGAWGHLGRKVDAAVGKLEAKGWVRRDQTYSATQDGRRGDRWRLTDTGTAALEG
ncbi:hypothetical protein ABZV65_30760 [Streptomyces bauhiniae]|uniref:hypothetical protein n=1 Tax=Streptomyces bauhiniae TaxID=2340725 RepID=UPI0033A9D07A